MLKKLTASTMALVMAAGMSLATVQPAEARNGAGIAVGVAAGIIGLGILGAAANARERTYYRDTCHKGPEECAWRDRHCFTNRYGDYVCRGGVYRCWRPTYCD